MLFPINSSGGSSPRGDLRAKQFTLIDTCFPTHHLQFARDANNTLWLSSANVDYNGPVIGWFNRRLFEQTHDEASAQGWTAFVLDTNGNGRRDAYTEPGEPPDPAKDRRLNVNTYGVA